MDSVTGICDAESMKASMWFGISIDIRDSSLFLLDLTVINHVTEGGGSNGQYAWSTRLWWPACVAVKAEQYLQTCPFICPSVISFTQTKTGSRQAFTEMCQSSLCKHGVTVGDNCMKTQGQVSGSNKSFTSPDMELIMEIFWAKTIWVWCSLKGKVCED